MIKILVRKHKDLIKIFAGLCVKSIHNLIFKIIPRFITDSAQDLDKNGPGVDLENQWRDGGLLEGTATMVKKSVFELYSRHYNPFFVSAAEKWKKISQGDGGRRVAELLDPLLETKFFEIGSCVSFRLIYIKYFITKQLFHRKLTYTF